MAIELDSFMQSVITNHCNASERLQVQRAAACRSKAAQNPI